MRGITGRECVIDRAALRLRCEKPSAPADAVLGSPRLHHRGAGHWTATAEQDRTEEKRPVHPPPETTDPRDERTPARIGDYRIVKRLDPADPPATPEVGTGLLRYEAVDVDGARVRLTVPTRGDSARATGALEEYAARHADCCAGTLARGTADGMPFVVTRLHRSAATGSKTEAPTRVEARDAETTFLATATGAAGAQPRPRERRRWGRATILTVGVVALMAAGAVVGWTVQAGSTSIQAADAASAADEQDTDSTGTDNVEPAPAPDPQPSPALSAMDRAHAAFPALRDSRPGHIFTPIVDVHGVPTTVSAISSEGAIRDGSTDLESPVVVWEYRGTAWTEAFSSRFGVVENTELLDVTGDGGVDFVLYSPTGDVGHLSILSNDTGRWQWLTFDLDGYQAVELSCGRTWEGQVVSFGTEDGPWCGPGILEWRYTWIYTNGSFWTDPFDAEWVG